MSVTAFIQYLDKNYSHLDIIINNAAQTVRHPPIYYKHLMENERKSVKQLPEVTWSLLSGKENFQEIENQPLLEHKDDRVLSNIATNFQRSAELSQIPVSIEDETEYNKIFPRGEFDQYHEQLDLRDHNTWVTSMDQVSIPEILEVQLINQIVPTMFVSKLKPLLMRSPNRFKFIVNVSSPEGQFFFDKDEGRHPHTCIAKAALNMLTFSIANNYARNGIFVTSVDPGWITEQFPLGGHGAINREFALDLEDAAARVCDPIFIGLNKNKFWRGKFFRHYKETKW
jgi:NAD(P)-dependent dehydrogenase (short-subunit alcohol dehydrogenase family)